MQRSSVILALLALAGGASALGFWQKSRRLADERDRAVAALAARPTDDRRGPVPSRMIFQALGRALDRADEVAIRDSSAPPAAPSGGEGTPSADTPPEPPPDWQERRARRQERLRAMLGRQPGETDDAYRARVGPLAKAVLAVPRERMSEARRQFEEAAGLSEEQRVQIDTAFAEAGSALVEVASQAVIAGELTPYERNTRGVLAFVGAAVEPLTAVDARVRQVLSPAQQQVLDESGFDILEYVGVHTPWESVVPPPPPPNE